MIERIELGFGPSPGAAPLAIQPGPMTVVVGPNSSGKSLFLREIMQRVRPGQDGAHVPKPLILSKLRPKWSGRESLGQRFLIEIAQDLEGLRLSQMQRVVDDSPLGGLIKPPSLSDGTSASAFRGFGDILNGINVFAHCRRLVDAGKIDALPFCERFGARGSRIEGLLTSSSPNDFVHVLLGFLKEEESDQEESDQEESDQEESDDSADLADLDGVEVIDEDEAPDELSLLMEEGLRFFSSIEQELHKHGPMVMAEQLIDAGILNLEAYVPALGGSAILLDGRSRLGLIEPQPIHSLYESPQNLLMALRARPKRLKQLREIVFSTFGYYVAIDILDMKSARLVVSDEDPGTLEYSTGTAARKYFQQAKDIRTLSDGERSFIGIYAALLSDDYRVILIDEPEAFLHPPLVRRMGNDLTRLAHERGAAIMAATHSADFVMGCIESGHNVDIVRLGYHEKLATARALPAAELRPMMRDPLLRSTNVLSALFHRTAIICEGNSDKAFYSEINERLRYEAQAKGQGLGWAKDCVFISSYSKHTIHRILGPLRRMGIPSAAITDLDILKNKEVLSQILEASGMDEIVRQSLGNMRAGILDKFGNVAESTVSIDASDRAKQVKAERDRLISRGGLENLGVRERQTLQHWLTSLASYGIFVVPRGELESWLVELSKGVRKSEWLVRMFEALGSLDTPETYVAPANGDVWAFIRDIGEWLENYVATGPV